MKKRRLKKKPVIILLLIVVFVILSIVLFIKSVNNNKKDNKIYMIELTDLNRAKEFSEQHNLNLVIKREYNDLEYDKIIYQSINVNEEIKENSTLEITVSDGPLNDDKFRELNVDELGFVPIMMYHGISNVKSSDTGYTGGNVDKDGYHRTSEAFIEDLEFYYSEGYRMIRLEDYVNGIIDVELGKSPIVLTFDDGLKNNIRVTGLDEDGNIIIDPNSAVGILESFKKKYPDYNVTATFFINCGLFEQPEYNEKILNWLVDNGYDIGNHTCSHIDFTSIDENESIEEVGSMYQVLDKYIKDKYVNIIALPFGSPYSENHENFKHILNGNYNGYEYNTISTLQVGWEYNKSPFSSSFNPLFLKRIRAYDNNGNDFDIKYNFDKLKTRKYISDGNKDRIVIKKEDKDYLGNTKLEVISY